MTTHATSAAVPVTSLGNPTRTSTAATRAMTHAGRSAIVIRGTALPILATRSPAISTCPADTSDRLCTTPETASTRYVDRRAARSRPSARFGSCRRAICAITMGGRPTRAQAICDICARKDSSEPSAWTVIGMSPWCSPRRAGACSNRHRRDHSHDHRHDYRQDHQQAFYAELKKPREVEHDSQVFRAYLRESERLGDRGARIDRVVLDYELKRNYQKWLHERDKDRDDADGRPDREPAEIEEWAHDHDLPYFATSPR